MTINHVIRITAVYPCCCSLVLLWPYLKGAISAMEVLVGSFFIFILWGLGVLVGIVISVIVKKPSLEPYFYLGGQLIIIMVAISVFGVSLYLGWQRFKHFGSIHNNEDYIERIMYTGDRDMVRKAYNVLAEKLPPNSISISYHRVKATDSTVDYLYQPLYTVQLDYIKPHDRNVYKAEIEVHNNNAVLQYYDRMYTSAEKYSSGLDEKQMKELLRDAIKRAPDSLRERMEEELKDALKE